MLSFSFTKKGDAVYISHIDILRGLQRTIRRAGVPIEYSKGYNPHMLINLSQPLPLGIASIDEWATIQTDYDTPNEFIRLFNAHSPGGMECTRCYVSADRPNIAGRVTASDYFISCAGAYTLRGSITDFFGRPFTIAAKNAEETKDVSGLVYDLDIDVDGIALRLAFGNLNLRIDRLADKLNALFGLNITLSDITRIRQLIKTDGGYIGVEDCLKVMS